jgi:hypothetical protein
MQIIRGAILALCTVWFCATLAPGGRADEWNKKTTVTFGDSVEIPGQVLPAGTYVFKLADSIVNRHVVQIWSEDESQILASIMAIATSQPEPHDRPMFQFDERPADSPMALKARFYPGDTRGQEFVYSDHSYPDSNSFNR